ncbi:hypothetical protein AC1031_001272 [Aphanomyces cochlioides]|nr:hypothetical protein AC1031_001272 [Aphanomyces cochlioides]
MGECPPEFDPDNVSKIDVAQLVFWDETHKQVKIGQYGACGSKRQVTVRRDINGAVDVQHGSFSAPRSFLKTKYPGESRFSFGCAVVEQHGEIHGVRCKPFVYTGRWIRTIEEYDRLLRDEIDRVKCLSSDSSKWITGKRSPLDGFFENDKLCCLPKIGHSTMLKLVQAQIHTISDLARVEGDNLSKVSDASGISVSRLQQLIKLSKSANPGSFVSKLVDHRRANNPYLSLYGTNWRKYIERSTNLKAHVCITSLIEHIMAESAACMRGTKFEESSLFVHDALSQMTCKSTIEWMKSQNYYARWLLPECELNKGTVYEGRPIGNSPELMPWDCSLNKDVDDSFHLHRVMTLALPSDSPYKFCSSTPGRLDSAYMRLIEAVPTSDRIITDVKKCFTDHILRIIEAKGAVVHGLGSRNGVRYLSIGGHGGLRQKCNPDDDKWLHPHARLAREMQLSKSKSTFESSDQTTLLCCDGHNKNSKYFTKMKWLKS